MLKLLYSNDFQILSLTLNIFKHCTNAKKKLQQIYDWFFLVIIVILLKNSTHFEVLNKWYFTKRFIFIPSFDFWTFIFWFDTFHILKIYCKSYHDASYIKSWIFFPLYLLLHTLCFAKYTRIILLETIAVIANMWKLTPLFLI